MGLNSTKWNAIAEAKKTAIYRLLQELMTNMKKHSEATITVLTFQKLNNNLEINDNGIGINLKKKLVSECGKPYCIAKRNSYI